MIVVNFALAFHTRPPLNFDPSLSPGISPAMSSQQVPTGAMSHEDMYRNQIRQKARQGNRQGESYLAGESRSSTPIQGPPSRDQISALLTTPNNQEQQSLNR